MPTLVPKPFHPKVEKLVRQFAETAVERDRQGGSAKRERDLLRASGLLVLAVPKSHGGLGAPWPIILSIVRRLAEVDSSLAHLFAFQHLQVATISLYGNAGQQRHFLEHTVRRNWFWGNALNPLDPRTVATPNAGGYVINGVKGFCSGAKDADYLMISALRSDNGQLLVAAVPAERPGILINDDWDAFGQRQTDSGSVEFRELQIGQEEVLASPGPGGSIYASLRPCLAQLILVNIYLGIAQGAFDTAGNFTREQARPWFSSGVATATADPYVLQHFAEMWVALRGATALADQAAQQLHAAWQEGDALSARQRGELSLAVAEAKVLAHRASLDISSRMLDVCGARATTGRLGLDRYWRNARTHTLHDPLDYKLRDIGEWALNGKLPSPSLYS